MANRADIDRALEELPAGSDVKVVMKDGSEVAGKLRSSDGDQVDLDQGDGEVDVDKDNVETILVEDSTEGPE